MAYVPGLGDLGRVGIDGSQFIPPPRDLADLPFDQPALLELGDRAGGAIFHANLLHMRAEGITKLDSLRSRDVLTDRATTIQLVMSMGIRDQIEDRVRRCVDHGASTHLIRASIVCFNHEGPFPVTAARGIVLT